MFRYYLLHLFHDSHIVKRLGDFIELNFVLTCQFVWIFTNGSHLDLWMMGWLCLLSIVQYLLKQLLTITKPCELNLDALGSRETDNALC